MTLATVIARPRSDSTHVLNCMGDIVLPIGYLPSIPKGKFTRWEKTAMIKRVQTIDETRRNRLELLIKRHDGKLANLNEALGLLRTASQLARIRNRNARTDRPGKFYEMGDDQAREIEERLSLDRGWMDTPLTCAELHGEDDPRAKVMLLMESMPPDQWATVVRLVDAVAQPTIATGTNDRSS